MKRMPARQFRTLVLALLLSAAASTSIVAQTGQKRVGEVEFPNSGAADAQESFLLGLALLHSFEYPEAREAFRTAQEQDPDFVMAYWGEAMAWNYSLWYEQNAEAAREILDRLAPTTAARAAMAPTDRERAWLAAVETLYGDGDKQARDDAYERAMAEIRHDYPEDPEAGAFHALAILGTAHEGRDHMTYMRAAAIAGDVFRDHPEHPGAAHYMIHSFDDPEHAPLGLAAARAYSGIAPDADHAQHMTTHIFLALGMWEDVVRANETADAVVDRDRAARGEGPSFCGHYNEWLLYGYLMEARAEDAMTLLEGCHRMAVAGGRAAASFSEMRARYVIDSEEWDGPALSMTADYGDRAGPPLRDAWLGGYVAGVNGDAGSTRAALERFRALRPAAEQEMRSEGLTDETYQRRPEVLELQLEGLALIAEGRGSEGLSRIESAAALEEQLPFTYGPPAIDKPSHELLGEMLLAAGRTEEAAEAFATAATRTPGRIPAVQGYETATSSLQAGVSDLLP